MRPLFKQGLLVFGSIYIFNVATSGLIIAVLLGFAIVSIYFYSTRIVDSGLAEVFVAVKGTMKCSRTLRSYNRV